MFVHIIESPSPKDLLDGNTEGRILLEALRLSDIKSGYSLCVNKETFLEALLGRSYELMQYYKLAPLFHISSHGSKEGISLTDGTSIPWGELRDLLLPINDFLKDSLVICISSCYSFNACSMAMREKDRLPFFGLVSHLEKPPLKRYCNWLCNLLP